MTHHFQVDLSGIIELLSDHIYSGPQVYLRELLQNGVDAVTARRALEPDHPGRLDIHVASRGEELVFRDDGIGLTEDEVHRFLATIGESAKRGGLPAADSDFLGQFGVGLLSCFVVSDEILVHTRSARPGAEPRTLEWRGRRDGTYEIGISEEPMEPGTRVTLRARPGCEEWTRPERVRELAKHFGAFLPLPVTLHEGDAAQPIGGDGPPWRRSLPDRAALHEAVFDCGRELFEIDFLDWIPLHSEAGGVDGVALVLPFTPSLTARRRHRVYLKGMLLSEEAENLLPEWAFFVRAVIDTRKLRPTASRESLYEDELLAQTRADLGDCLRQWLVAVASEEPDRLQRLLGVHMLSLKALAAHDDEFFGLVADWLPFETSLGRMSFGEYRRRFSTVYYTPSVDEFRQIAPVATAQGTCVINAGYSYDTSLVERAGYLLDGLTVERMDASRLVHGLRDLELAERDGVVRFLEEASRALASFECEVQVRKFQPKELPALYGTDDERSFLREIERAREESGGLWAGVLGDLAAARRQAAPATLCFNFENELVRKLTLLEDEALLPLAIRLLYVHTLLLGHRPLHGIELQLLNGGLLELIDWSLAARPTVLQ